MIATIAASQNGAKRFTSSAMPNNGEQSNEHEEFLLKECAETVRGQSGAVSEADPT